MTAKAGEHRTIRLPEDLIRRIDTIRGTIPRERWIRALLYRVTGDLLIDRRLMTLQFDAAGALQDTPRPSPPPDDVDALAVIASALGSLGDAEIEARGLGPVKRGVDAVAGRVEAEQVVRTVPLSSVPPLGGPGALAPTQAERKAAPRLRLKRPEAKP